MDKNRTVDQKWLANELDLHFLTLQKCTKGQSNRSILSKVIVLTNYKSTDTLMSLLLIWVNLLESHVTNITWGNFFSVLDGGITCREFSFMI